MKHYKYLIVGGGLAGDAATRGIRELDADGSIGLISAEPDAPYMRPNLSKGLWKGRPLEKIWRKTEERAELLLGRAVTSLDTTKKTVKDNKGGEYTYDKLLVATGGSPIRLPFGLVDITYFRDLQDYQRLRKMADEKNRFVVIGGGFIGSEIAAALTMAGKQVTMIFLEDAIGGRVFPTDLARHLNDYYREKGVDVIANDSVTSIQMDGDHLTVQTGSGRVIDTDGIVAGIGIRPNVALAQEAGLNVENGIVVNESLQTSAPDVFAAGDAANFFHIALGKRARVEHEDNAVAMGKLAGRNMAGASETFTHIPLFYSDLFDLGYEAVGEMNSQMEIVSDWDEPFKKGVIYYLADGRVRGVLLWNVWKKLGEARALLMEKGPFKAEELMGRIKGE
ncbi:MAG TPA: FAD-dependent oxidoreductase [Anaerolineales bacterium]|jgi:3-phenylpropionate/trans-cinnamate dioxygenase ferredoxin reductase subunit|nr:FAD-dependent oxidoreductase [Anaerolineales bacterium]HQX14903.1 FAD-dependent oxidoreductase [Anaerolineales bacterium]